MVDKLCGYFNSICTNGEYFVVTTDESDVPYRLSINNWNFYYLFNRLLVAFAQKRRVTIHFEGPENEIVDVSKADQLPLRVSFEWPRSEGLELCEM